MALLAYLLLIILVPSPYPPVLSTQEYRALIWTRVSSCRVSEEFKIYFLVSHSSYVRILSYYVTDEGQYLYKGVVWEGHVNPGVHYIVGRALSPPGTRLLVLEMRINDSLVAGDTCVIKVLPATAGGWKNLRIDRSSMDYKLEFIDRGGIRRVDFEGDRIYVEGKPWAWKQFSKVILYTKEVFTVKSIEAEVMTHNSGSYEKYGTEIHLGIMLSDGTLIELTKVRPVPDQWYVLRVKVPSTYSNYHIAVWITQSNPNRYFISAYEFKIGALRIHS